MSELETIARPYAKAAYERAKETNSVDHWQIFVNLSSSFFEQSSIRKNLLTPGFLQELISWIDELAEKVRGQGLNQEEKNYLNVLNDLGRLSILPQISSLFQKMVDAADGICEVKVYAARKLEESDLVNLKRKLEDKIKKKINLNIIEQPELQAGIKIEYEDMVIDQSMKGKIEQFSRQLEDTRN